MAIVQAKSGPGSYYYHRCRAGTSGKKGAVL